MSASVSDYFNRLDRSEDSASFEKGFSIQHKLIILQKRHSIILNLDLKEFTQQSIAKADAKPANRDIKSNSEEQGKNPENLQVSESNNNVNVHSSPSNGIEKTVGAKRQNLLTKKAFR